MKWYDNTADSLQTGRLYSHADLIHFLKKDYPYVSDNSYHWAIQEMLKEGRIVRKGYDRYAVTDGTALPVFEPRYSGSTMNIMDCISTTLPSAKFVVTESVMFNEFLEAPIESKITFLQVEKKFGEDILSLLMEKRYAGVLYKPTKDMFGIYLAQDCIVISDLVSESPINQRQPHSICLEKLLVDMFCDKYMSVLCNSTLFSTIFDTALNRYNIDRRRFLRYADRRGKKDALVLTIPDFMEKDSVETAKDHKYRDIVSAAARILNTLPKTQQELYIDINGGKLSQADMARYYNVKPQAVTNRISRLYKTVIRRLQAEYGFSEEEIKEIGNGSAMSFFRRVPRQYTDFV